ncbi:MAG: hypothetical protein Q7V88_17625 [Actinomycetota bacterium]|nr:hypothetical protein [Actinomycetota bacterium]
MRVRTALSALVVAPAAALLTVSVAACSGGGSGGGSGVAATAPLDVRFALAPLLQIAEAGQWRSDGDDTFEVWVCHVPADSTAAIYGGLPLRLALTPAGAAATFTARVTPYYDALSGGRYRPVFVAGGEVAMAAGDEPQACVDAAIAGAGDATRAIIAVADAEHAAGQVGGFGSGGDPCPAQPPCAVGASRRSAYVGASDFNPRWGEVPPMDLVQHEIGHTLGWVHSGVDSDGGYLSALDVMSNSAAPRDIDPQRLDAPGTLAVNRLLAGWLGPESAWVAPAAGGTIVLAPSAGAGVTRLAVVALGDDTFLTIELLVAAGPDGHLPADGIAVHRVQVADGLVQPIEPLVGSPPFTDLLQPGESLDAEGWHVEVAEVAGAADGWSITVVPNVGA